MNLKLGYQMQSAGTHSGAFRSCRGLNTAHPLLSAIILLGLLIFSPLHASNSQPTIFHVPFVENTGQYYSDIRYFTRTFNGVTGVYPDGTIYYSLSDPDSSKQLRVTERAVTDEPDGLIVQGSGVTPTRVSYFRGSDPSRWRSQLPTYDRIDLGEVADGISMVLVARGDSVEKLFTLDPGSDVSDLALDITTHRPLTIDDSDRLSVTTVNGIIAFSRPIAWQVIDGTRRPVDVDYSIVASNRYGFRLGQYDTAHAVIIDPLLQSTYYGGSAGDTVQDLVVSDEDRVLVAGFTASADLPGAGGGPNGSTDGYVMALDDEIRTFVSAIYLGGDDDDRIHGMDVDDAGAVYVTGQTGSSNFPFSTAYGNPAGTSMFVTHIDKDLSGIVESIIIGGSATDAGRGIVVYPGNDIYITGETASGDMPTNGSSWDQFNNGGVDAFVAGFDGALNLQFTTYIGGDNSDAGLSIGYGPVSGDIVIAGYNDNGGYPTTGGVVQTGAAGMRDSVISVFSPNLDTLRASSYHGGTFNEQINDLVLLPGDDTAFVIGSTQSTSLPGAGGGFQSTNEGLADAFIASFKLDLMAVTDFTFVGGEGSEDGNRIAIDNNGRVYATGQTGSSNFPASASAYDTTLNGGSDAFIITLPSDLRFNGSTASYLGGSAAELGHGVGWSAGLNRVFFAGDTSSGDFPLVGSPVQSGNNGVVDNYIAMFSIDLAASVLQFASSSYNESEAAGTSSIAVRRIGSTAGIVSVTCSTSNGTASAGSDYTTTNQMLNWADGDGTDKFCTIPINDDLFDETNETVNLALVNPVGAGLGDQSNAVMNIIDNDGPAVSLNISAGSMPENGGNVTVTAILDATSPQNVIVNLGFSGAADNGLDYLPDSSSIIVLSGSTSGQVVIAALDDDIDDDDENIDVDILSVNNGTESGVQQVSANITDDDTAGFLIMPVSGLITDESGTTDTFSVELTSEPLDDVSVPLFPSDAMEITTDTTNLVFTATDWNLPQIVTVRGEMDSRIDGDQLEFVDIQPVSSTDSLYNGLDPVNVSVTNIDIDGNTVSIFNDANGNEPAANGRFEVRLDTPTLSDSDTVISYSIAGSATAGDDYQALSGSVTIPFNTQNTFIDITVFDDLIDEDTEQVTVTLSGTDNPAIGISSLNMMADVDIDDNDTAGVSVVPSGGLVTDEGGGPDFFNVSLFTEPLNNVTINLSSSDAGEGTVMPTSLVFTPLDWNIDQQVDVQGVDDLVDDGDQPYSILTSANSTDSKYNGIPVSNVGVINLNDDFAGVILVLTSPDTASDEAGDTVSFDVQLASQPVNPVTVTFASDDPSEGVPDSAGLVFNSLNWNIAQPITVTGQDDDIDDDDVPYTLLVGISTTDPAYSLVDPPDEPLINLDDDLAGIILVPGGGLFTNEFGAMDSFTIELATEPLSPVSINLGSNTPGEAVTDLSNVMFDAGNWNMPQTITVTGVDDPVIDGDVAYDIVIGIASSADPVYNGFDAPDVSGLNQDNDFADILVSPLSLETDESGNMDSFSVVLNSQPIGPVDINLTNTDPTEGSLDTAMLQFTPGDWDMPQVVTVTGVDDNVIDNDIAYSVILEPASSPDPDYNNFDAFDVAVNNLDLDTTTVSIAGLLNAAEPSTPGQFEVSLNFGITVDVDVDVDYSVFGSATEGTDYSSLGGTVTIFAGNSSAFIDIFPIDDMTAEGDENVFIQILSTNRPPVTIESVEDTDNIELTDDDMAGVIPIPAGPFTTAEDGTVDSFDVSLASVPLSNVTISFSSTNSGETTVSPTNVMFTPGDWNIPQTVTLTGVDDPIDDDDVVLMITATTSSADPFYNGLPLSPLTVTNLDDDTVGVDVIPNFGLLTGEDGTTDSFDVSLKTQPLADVMISLVSDNPAEGVPVVSGLTFNTLNWNIPQTVIVNGVDDAVDDGDVGYSIVTAATSSDLLYNGIAVDDPTLTNIDDDATGIDVNPLAGLMTTEAGGTAQFMVVLESEPLSDVMIPLLSDTPAEGTPDTAMLTFTAADWDQVQTVTVTGADDDVVDGNVVYNIQLGTTSSLDPAYDNLDPPDVNLQNLDDDVASIQVMPTIGLTTTEAGGTASFMVVLTSEPTAVVTINVSSDTPTEGTPDTAMLSFDAVDWNIAKTVIITGQDDVVADGDIAYNIILATAASADPNYNGLDPTDVSVTNTDNEVAGVSVNPTSGLVTTEAGGTDSFDVVLNTMPTADVVISLSSSNAAEGVPSPTSLTFTTGDWNMAQTVTVTGVDDAVSDGDVGYSIITSLSSSDLTYNVIDPADVSVSNTDDDVVGINVVPVAGLITDEGGGSAMFDVVLNSQPLADVSIGLSSSDTGEGTVGSSSLTFMPGDWDMPQTVTVTGVADAQIDGDQPYTVITAAASSTDPAYNGLDPMDVSVSNTDTDTTTVSVTGTANAAEPGTDGSFSVTLDGGITATVPVAVTYTVTGTATAGNDYTALSGSVIIGAGSASAPVAVVVSDDPVAEGTETVQLNLSGTDQAAITVSGVSGMDSIDITDNDTAGFTVTPTAGLTTTEAGGTASFTVVLDTQPTASVSVSLASSDSTEGSVSPAALSFTTGNWDTAQMVTVTGIDDAEDDGDVAYSITTSASSGDAIYDALDPADVSVSNTDNDTAGVSVTPTSGLVTTEAGGTDSFQVVLETQPTLDVVINLSSSDAGEGTPSPASLTFTTGNWNVIQTVTVTGQDDAEDDGDVAYSIITAMSTADPVYTLIDPADVAASNSDNDTAGVSVTPTSGLVTTEAGGTDSFDVVLNTMPTADVVISLSSSNAAEGMPSPASLTFTTGDWNMAQTVTVTGVDDAVSDGDIGYSIITSLSSSDLTYNVIDPADVSVSNTDDDVVGINVVPVAGLITDEGGGSAMFDVVLNSQPLADVSIGLSSSDTGEGTVGSSSLTFMPGDWDMPQTVTVTGVADAQIDGDQPYTVITAAASSTDPAYNGLDPMDVSVSNTDTDTTTVSVTGTANAAEPGTDGSFSVTLDGGITATVPVAVTYTVTGTATAGNDYTALSGSVIIGAGSASAPVAVVVSDDPVAEGTETVQLNLSGTDQAAITVSGVSGMDSIDITDNDTAGFTVTPTAGLTTTEAGGTASFTVVLDTQPTASVSVSLDSSDSTEGSVSPAALSFTTGNWDTAQMVTVTGVDDAEDDGDVAYSITTSASSGDAIYDALDPADVSVSNTDNDTAGVSVTPTSGLVTTEAGGTDSFQVVLETQPTLDMVINLSSSDAGEGTPSPASLTFTTGNWNVIQTVTVTGQDDAEDDGDVAYSIITAMSTADPVYTLIDPADVAASNSDNDTAGVSVTPTAGLVTTEAGGTDSFDVVLNTMPTADVVISLSSSNAAEGVPSPTSLTFTTGDWNMAQTVTVTGVDDAVSDGDVGYSIITSLSSSDLTYNVIDPADVSVTNTDNDSAMFTLQGITNLEVSEDGVGTNFGVMLNAQPTADVTIDLSSSDETEGVVFPASMTFTTSNWNSIQLANIFAQDDQIIDGDVQFNIITSDAMSADMNYDGLVVPDVPVINRDNDAAGFTVLPSNGLITSETGGSTGFRVNLNAPPVADVTIDLSSSDETEGQVMTSTLTFTVADWSVSQFVQVNGMDDGMPDGNQSYRVLTHPATSTDPNYNGMDAVDVSIINTDDETATIIITPVDSLVTDESGQTATFSVVLSRQPSADVSLDLRSSDTTEGTVSPSMAGFTAANWQVPQTITVTGVDDAIIDGDQAYSILTDPAVSTDPAFNGLDADNVSVNNRDNDVSAADLRIEKSNGLTDVAPGQMVTYLITVSNVGSQDIVDARVTDFVPFELIAPVWTCSGIGGGLCTASGEGDIDELVTLPVGAMVEFMLTATVDADSTIVSNTASVETPIGFIDGNLLDNEATDSDTVSLVIFTDGFEDMLVVMKTASGVFLLHQDVTAGLSSVPSTAEFSNELGVDDGIQVRRARDGALRYRHYVHDQFTGELELSEWLHILPEQLVDESFAPVTGESTDQ